MQLVALRNRELTKSVLLTGIHSEQLIVLPQQGNIGMIIQEMFPMSFSEDALTVQVSRVKRKKVKFKVGTVFSAEYTIVMVVWGLSLAKSLNY